MKDPKIILVTFTGCGHAKRYRVTASEREEATCAGECPNCVNAPLLVYRFGDRYHVRYPADMGGRDERTQYPATAHVDDIVAIFLRANPERNVFHAHPITSAKYAAKARAGLAELREGVEQVLMVLCDVLMFTPFVIRDDNPQAEV